MITAALCRVCGQRLDPVITVGVHPGCEPPGEVAAATARAVLRLLAAELGARPLRPALLICCGELLGQGSETQGKRSDLSQASDKSAAWIERDPQLSRDDLRTDERPALLICCGEHRILRTRAKDPYWTRMIGGGSGSSPRTEPSSPLPFGGREGSVRRPVGDGMTIARRTWYRIRPGYLRADDDLTDLGAISC